MRGARSFDPTVERNAGPFYGVLRRHRWLYRLGLRCYETLEPIGPVSYREVDEATARIVGADAGIVGSFRVRRWRWKLWGVSVTRWRRQ